MQVKVSYADPYANVKPTLPIYATEGAGAFDIFAFNIVVPVRIQQGIPAVFRTGLVFEIPKDHVMLLFSRSGQGFKHDTRLSNCVGVIDEDYRGEVMIKLTRDNSLSETMVVHPNERIAQGIILPRPKVEFQLVDNPSMLSSTARGANGFGSTNTN